MKVAVLCVVGDFGDVETIAETDAQDLVVAPGQVVHVDNQSGPLGLLETLPQRLVELSDVDAGYAGRGDEDDTDDFLEDIMSGGEGKGLANAAMDWRIGVLGDGDDGVLNLERGNNLAAPVDDFFASAGDEEEAVSRHVAQVAGIEPAIAGEAGPVDGTVWFEIAREDRLPAHRDSAHSSWEHTRSFRTEDGQLRAHSDA